MTFYSVRTAALVQSMHFYMFFFLLLLRLLFLLFHLFFHFKYNERAREIWLGKDQCVVGACFCARAQIKAAFPLKWNTRNENNSSLRDCTRLGYRTKLPLLFIFIFNPLYRLLFIILVSCAWFYVCMCFYFSLFLSIASTYKCIIYTLLIRFDKHLVKHIFISIHNTAKKEIESGKKII